MDITHDNVCSSMLSCFYSHLLSTGRPISSLLCFQLDDTELKEFDEQAKEASKDLFYHKFNVSDHGASLHIEVSTLAVEKLF